MSQNEVREENFTNNTADEPFDLEAAKKKILDFFGPHLPRKTCGWKILVAIYTRQDESLKLPDGTASRIVAAATTVADDKYKSCTGMVIQMGPIAYKGARYAGQDPWCRLGDWVSIGRNDGQQFDFMGKPIMRIDDDKIGNVIDSPDQIKRGEYA